MDGSNSAPQRLHALDAVRAFALLSGIVLHATMSFLPGFADVGWIIADDSTSVTLAVLFFTIHQFRMTLFFVIAGFFGHMAFHRRGFRAFVLDRFRRITIPLVGGWLVLFPLIIIAFIVAAAQNPQMATKPPESPKSVMLAFPLTHLWFLYVLQWLYLFVLVTRSLFTNVFDRSGTIRSAIDRLVAALLAGPWSVLVMALPVGAALFLQDDWSRWFGVPTPDQSLIPNLPAFVEFVAAFSLGWVMHRQINLLRIWERDWRLYFIMGICLTILSLAIVGPVPIFAPEARNGWTLVYAACYSLAAWSWTFALIGIGLRFFSNPNHQLRYLADSSYWLYLVHLPLVFLAQAIVMHWNLHWTIKFPLILLTTIPLMLLSYHFLVRPTWIGWLLNGRKYPIFAPRMNDGGDRAKQETQSLPVALCPAGASTNVESAETRTVDG